MMGFFSSRIVSDTSDLWIVPHELELSVFLSQYVCIYVLGTSDVSSYMALWGLRACCQKTFSYTTCRDFDHMAIP